MREGGLEDEGCLGDQKFEEGRGCGVHGGEMIGGEAP